MIFHLDHFSDEARALRDEAVRLAGDLGALAQRAAVYHHLFEHSGRNHTFPLLAAHGALWARGYFQTGLRAGSVLVWQYVGSARQRQSMLTALVAFADAFRDINRRVCIETYYIYHLTGSDRLRTVAEQSVPAPLLEAMLGCHAARRAGRQLSLREQRDLFTAFFFWEQDNIVGPAVTRAFGGFDWPAIRALARRPTIRFSYLPRSSPLTFRNFEDTTERVEKGLQAFDIGAEMGWSHVAGSLGRYRVLPEAFHRDSRRHFETLRAAALSREAILPLA